MLKLRGCRWTLVLGENCAGFEGDCARILEAKALHEVVDI